MTTVDRVHLRELAKLTLLRAKHARKRKWKWSPQKATNATDLPYVSECASLGDTLIQLANTYDGSDKDCAFVSNACSSAPVLAAAVLELLEEVKRLNGELNLSRVPR